ncbi:MAG: hypothetical protein M3282_10685, partial [Gemmatimonadota bacterium]|nr:hypothetical protein [Gemmatimonadota bacterium]
STTPSSPWPPPWPSRSSPTIACWATGSDWPLIWLEEVAGPFSNEGPQTAEERALGFAFFDPSSTEAQVADYWQRKDLTPVREEHVMALASHWSVDPSSLSERNLEVGDGLVGDFGERPSPP